LWGVYRFKQGFSGREVTYTGGWDFVYNPLLYRLYQYRESRRAAGGLAAAG
jgi:lipid II:glycine glycyltransferase (peptidoglycan interpeptide bridge formation enzyme)